MSALNDPIRRKILIILRKEKISSGDLANRLQISPSKLSYHLSLLKKADLVYETKYKNFIYYELNLTIIDQTVLWLDTLKRGDFDE